jgi:hypothetical protein
MKMKDQHMQRYLVNKWLCVGHNVEVFDGDIHVIDSINLF